MIDHLATLVENFPGAANQTRCFTHILNLVAKSVLHQFDMPKKTAENESMDFDDAKTALAALAQELEDGMVDDVAEEEELSDGEMADDKDCDDDNNDGLGGERDGMSEEEVAELEESLVPIRLMLTKVSKPNYSI